MKTKGPDPKNVTGKYVVVWEKNGNDWKLAVHRQCLEITGPDIPD